MRTCPLPQGCPRVGPVATRGGEEVVWNPRPGRERVFEGGAWHHRLCPHQRSTSAREFADTADPCAVAPQPAPERSDGPWAPSLPASRSSPVPTPGPAPQFLC